MKKKKPFRFIELFARLGGFRLGLESCNGTCVGSTEQDDWSARVYRQNFGDMPIVGVANANHRNIPEHDVMCGGFPCTDFSMSGTRVGSAGQFGSLIFEVARVIGLCQPRFLLLENVPGLVTLDNGRHLAQVLHLFENEGYQMRWEILNAADFGHPQARRRVYFVGVHNDLGQLPIRFPRPVGERVPLSSILQAEWQLPNDCWQERHYLPIDSNVSPYGTMAAGWICQFAMVPKLHEAGIATRSGKTGKWTKGKKKQWTRSELSKMLGASRVTYSDTQLSSVNHCMPTLVTKTQHILLPDNRARRLTMTERLRLQGFPDEWETGTPSQSTMMTGQAVIPAMVERVFRSAILPHL